MAPDLVGSLVQERQQISIHPLAVPLDHLLVRVLNLLRAAQELARRPRHLLVDLLRREPDSHDLGTAARSILTPTRFS
jgi:hypothetical protein